MAINDPRDIPGLVAWYSAEAETGYSDGASMAQWTDLSGNGNHATAVAGGGAWQATTGPGGGPAVYFSAGAHFALPAMFAGAVSGEALAAIKAAGASRAGLWTIGTGNDSSYPYSASTITEAFGSSSAHVFNGPTLTNWHRYGVWSAANDWSAHFEGTVYDSTVTNTVAWHASPLLGRSLYRDFTGHLAAVILYNRKLTATERSDLDAWLAVNPSGGIAAEPPAPEVTFAGDLPALAGSFALDRAPVSRDLTFSGSLPALTGSFAVEKDVAPEVTFAGDLPALAGSFSLTTARTIGTDVANHANRIGVVCRGYVEPNPPVVPVPPTLVRGDDKVMAFAYTMPAMTNGRPDPIDPDEVKVDAHRDRIIVGGKDVTYFRDEKTPVPGYKLIQPLAYDSTTLTFPQTHAIFEEYGKGALKWLDKEARVEIQRVDENGNVVGRDYRGVITAVRASGRMWVADVAGEFVGRAANEDRDLPLFRWVRDLGRHAFAATVGLGLRFEPKLGPVTGIEIPGAGGMRMLDWVNQVCAMAVKKNGDHYTLMPSEANPRVWEFRVKDTTTRHCSIYLDAARMVPELVDDITEQPNRIKATGVTPEGMIVKNGKYPGLRQAPSPDYPFADNRTFGVGTTDSTTGITNGSIAALNWRLIGSGYLERMHNGPEYTTHTEAAVEDLQDDAGLTATGDVDPATWDALFDNSVVGYSIRQSRIEPMAQRSYVRPWRLSASGAKIARNPNYDPTRLKVDRTIDFGAGHTKQQMREWARRELNRGSGKNWVGTIRVQTGAVIRGEHTPGTPLTEADVMPLRELRPGMNAWLPLFNGGTLVHIVGIDIDEGGRTGTLTVDTKYRDILTVAEIVARNRESRRDPARAFLNQHLSSKNRKDSLITFDEVGGLVFDKILLPANEWTEFPVVAGQEGTIRRIETLLRNNLAEYVLTVWGKRPHEENLTAKFPDPFVLDEDGDPVWALDARQDFLERKVLLYAAGDEEQPLGYWPRKHTNRMGNTTAHPITGKWVDDAQVSYHTLGHHVLWVAIFPKQACELNRGRIMWPQLEAGS